MKKSNSQWMSIGEAAKYLSVSRDTLRRWEKKRKIKAIRSPTNHRYYTKKMLDAIMKTPSKQTVKTKVGQLTIITLASFIAAAVLALAIQFLILK